MLRRWLEVGWLTDSSDDHAETGPQPRLLYTLTDVGRAQPAKLVTDDAPHTGPEESAAGQALPLDTS